MVNVTKGGTLAYKTPKIARNLIANSQQIGTRYDPTPRRMNEVNVFNNVNSQKLEPKHDGIA